MGIVKVFRPKEKLVVKPVYFNRHVIIPKHNKNSQLLIGCKPLSRTTLNPFKPFGTSHKPCLIGAISTNRVQVATQNRLRRNPLSDTHPDSESFFAKVHRLLTRAGFYER